MKATLNFGSLNIHRQEFIDEGRKPDANRLKGVENRTSVTEIVNDFHSRQFHLNVRPTNSNKAKNSVAAYLTHINTGKPVFYKNISGGDNKLMKVKGNVDLVSLTRKLSNLFAKESKNIIK